MAIGRTLNVCCGMSRVGEVRVDLDPKSNRTQEGDLHELNFPRASFDTVICDPPFSFYNRFRWILSLKDIARKRILLSSPLIQLHMGTHWEEKVWLLKDNMMFLRLWRQFDRVDGYIDVMVEQQ